MATFLRNGWQLSPEYAALMYIGPGRYEKADKLICSAKNLFEKINDTDGIALCLAFLGASKYFQKKYEDALQKAEKCISIFRKRENKWELAMGLRVSGISLNQLGKYDKAQRDLEEALSLYRELQDSLGTAYALRNLGLVFLLRGSYTRTAELCRESLALAQKTGDRWSLAWAMEELAAVTALGTKQFIRAARIYGSATAMREDINIRRPGSEQAIYDRGMAILHKKLTKKHLEKAWEEGQELNIDEAIHYALSDEFPKRDSRN